MCRALRIMDSLRLVSIVCVFDQAIYCKACEIKWKEPKKFENCVLMMGIFHLLMVYMGILKKRFGDAGLRDALIQGSVVAEGSVDMALRGKNYKRGVRLYKIFYEALLRLLIKHLSERIGDECIVGFLSWKHQRALIGICTWKSSKVASFKDSTTVFWI